MKPILDDMVDIVKISDCGAHESYGSTYQLNRTCKQIYPKQPI